MRPYQISGLVLNSASTAPQQRSLVLALQEDLRSLGYIAGGLDGAFGRQTARGLAALSYDLLKNRGASSASDGPAPVAIADYNKGRVQDIKQELDQALAACIDELVSDAKVPKLPQASDPAGENARAITLVKGLVGPTAPAPFMLAMFVQESASRHFKVPNAKDADAFITIGLDHNDPASDIHITSRGYGLGQATLFHHPPRPEEITSLMLDPAANVRAAFKELRENLMGSFLEQRTQRTIVLPNIRYFACGFAGTRRMTRAISTIARTVRSPQAQLS